METSIYDDRIKELFEELQWQMAQTDLTEPHSQSNNDFIAERWATTGIEVGGVLQSAERSEENGLSTLRDKLKEIQLARGIEQMTAVRVVFDNGDTVLIESLDDAALDRTDPIQKADIISSGKAAHTLLELKNMKIKMYGDEPHLSPHVHIDYGGKNNHVASFEVATGKILNGTLFHRKHTKDVTSFLSKHKEELLMIWRVLQSGRDPRILILELKGEA